MYKLLNILTGYAIQGASKAILHTQSPSQIQGHVFHCKGCFDQNGKPRTIHFIQIGRKGDL